MAARKKAMPIFSIYIRKTILKWNLPLLVVSKTNMVTTFFCCCFYLAYARIYTVFVNLLLRSNSNEKQWSSKNVPNSSRKRGELPWPSFKQRLDILFRGAPSSRQPPSACCFRIYLKCPFIPFQIEPISYDWTR